MISNEQKKSLGLAALPLAGALLVGLVSPGLASAATPSSEQVVVDGARAYVVTNGVRAADAETVACDASAPNGTANDQAIANALDNELTGKLKGFLTAYRISCAREVSNAVAAYGLDEHAAQIAITATIAESTLEDLTSGSGSSVGLYQEETIWGGTIAQREDPTWSTDSFLNKMVSKYPNNSWENASVGDVDNAVQAPKDGSVYQPQANDAGLIAEALTGIPYTRSPGDFDNSGLDDLSGDDYGDLLYADTGHNVDWVPNGINVNAGHEPFYGGPASTGVAFGVPNGALEAAGDVSGDGYADLLVYNPGNDTVAYYPNNINSGHGAYATGYTVASGLASVTGSPVVKIFAADITGDGHADLEYLTADGNLWYIPNNIDTNPGHTPYYVGATKIANGLANAPITIGDINGDHFADIVYYVGGSLHVIYNDILSDPNHQPFDTAGQAIATPAGLTGLTQLTATDITGDGYAGLLWSNSHGDVGYLANNTLSNPDHGYFETQTQNVAEIESGSVLT